MPMHLFRQDEDWALLMARAQGGDQHAYRLLLRGVTPYLRGLVRRGLRDAPDVEEVVQDVLLTIHQIRHSYDPARPFAPWLVAIAQRRVADRIRANIQHARRKQAIAEDMLVRSEAAPPVLDPDAYDGLYSAIGALPNGQRQAIQLLKLRQMSLKEASAQTGLSVTALKVASHRAVKRLQQVLGPVGCFP